MMLLITWGYVHEPRMHWCAQEFCYCTELLVLSSLYIIGHGASFHLLWPFCHISASKFCTFFNIFLDATNSLANPKNVTELLLIARSYKDIGLPGCCGSMDVVYVQWSQFLWVI
jgi:hypothetical protein